MAIDRAGRAKRRWERREAEASQPEPQQRRAVGEVALGIDGLFNPGAKHQLEQLAYVAVTREDDHETGSGPLDLDSATVRLNRRGE